MFKRISIIFLVLCTILAFTLGVNATALTVVKPADNSYIEYLSGSTSILKIGPNSVFTTSWTTTNTYTSMAVTDSTDTSLTTNAVVVTGGIAVTKRLWLGDDINMTTNTTGIYDLVLKDGQADALSITREGTAIIVFDTSTPKVTITPITTITGLLTAGGGITVGVSNDGETVTFYGDNVGSNFVWAEAGDSNQGTLTLGASTDYVDFKAFGNAASTYFHWDGSEDDLLLVGATTQLAIAGTATSTTSTTGSLRTAGGLGVAGTANFGSTVGIAGAVTIGGAVGITGNVTLVSTSKLYFLDTEIYIYSSADSTLDIVSNGTIAVSAPGVTFTSSIATSATYGVLIDYNAPFATIGNIHSAMLDLDVTTTSSEGGNWDVNGRLYGERITVNLVHAVTNTYGLKSKVLTSGTTTINDVVGVFGELEIDGTHTRGQTESSMAALRGDIQSLSDGSWTGQVYNLFLNYGSGKNYGLETAWIHAYNHADSYLDYGIHLIQNSTAQAIAVGIWLDIESSTTMTKGIFLDNAGTLTTGIDIGDATTGINLDGTYTTGLSIAGTLASADAKAIKSVVTINNCNLGDGYGTNEFQLTVTGTGAGHIAATSSWVNIITGTHGGGGAYITPLTVGVYEEIAATIDAATIIFGMHMTAMLGDGDANVLAPFSLNVSGDTIDAVWYSGAKEYLGWSASTGDGESGIVPYLIDSNGRVWYIRLYDS